MCPPKVQERVRQQGRRARRAGLGAELQRRECPPAQLHLQDPDGRAQDREAGGVPAEGEAGVRPVRPGELGREEAAVLGPGTGQEPLRGEVQAAVVGVLVPDFIKVLAN